MTAVAAAGGDEWVVVGGKGKPRKQSRQQQQQGTSSGILAAAGPAARDTTAAAAAAAEVKQGALPGWEAPAPTPTGTAGGFTYSSSSSSSTSTSTSSSKRGGRRQQQQQQGSSTEQQVQRLQQQVQDIARDLRQAGVYQALTSAMQCAAAAEEPPQQQQQQQQQQQWDWSAVQQLVVYGLGSVEDSRVSKHQLAMVLLLQELLPGLQQPPQLYDPAFTPLDCCLLRQLGLAVVAVNEEGRRGIAGQQTLFFLPHCEGVLCDNLLSANWSPDQLSQLAILGNSFDSYQERWSGPPNLRPSTTRPGRLLQLVEAGVVHELSVPDCGYPVASAFNDMSLHTFTAAAAAVGQLEGLFGAQA